MPRPFIELTREQFADMLAHFPWRRKVTEVHVHHTFRPNHADFASRPPIQAIEGMYRFHTEERHFSDIAQHVTIDPRGVIWTGRNWNAAPASATGFNGNAGAGPFMFEMIGNFDLGQDRWENAQRDTAIDVIARVQRLFGLPPTAFRFHHEMSPKSCPGSALRKADVLEAVTAAHERLGTPREARRGAFGEDASPTRATVDRILRQFDVDPAAMHRSIGEGELPEADMSLGEGEMSAGDPSAFAAGRGLETRALTPEDFALLRKHVINLRMGAFSTGGVFQTSADDVTAMFHEHISAFLADRKGRDPGAMLKLVCFAHGGLNDEVESLTNARNRIPFYLANGCYPVFFVWETGVKETLRDILGQVVGLGPGRDVGGAITSVSDPVFEAVSRRVGFSMWANMKLSAERAFMTGQGGTFFLDRLIEFWKLHSTEMEIHAIGHSAGSIFLAQFISALCQRPSNPPTPVQSLHFLAPAITVQLFKDTLKDLVGGRVKAMTQFTMAKDFELADSVGGIYRKSLLYLVSRAFEDDPEMPILGLEESIRRDPDIFRFFGLLGNKKGQGEILFSVRADGPSHSTIARHHGDFDNDRMTMSGVIRRILNVTDDASIVEFPETVSRGVDQPFASSGSTPPPTVAATIPAAAASAAVMAGPRGGRRAVCVGIDAYDPPNRLAGCVNDAREWATALRGLDFDTSLLLDGQATWDGIQNAMRDLVASSRPGDVAVFQYAGHGTRVPDADGDEESGRDSALCPIDFPTGRFLIDDDVRRIFQDLQDGVNLTCFFDCCHSGTITRLVAPTPPPKGTDVRKRGFFATSEMKAAHLNFRSDRRNVAPPPRGQLEMKEVSFGSCTDSQTAQEMNGHGEFTVRALALLRQGAARMTNADFVRAIVSAFGSDASEQTPQIDCSPSARTLRLLAPIAGRSALAGAPTLETIVARLDAIERRVAQLGA